MQHDRPQHIEPAGNHPPRHRPRWVHSVWMILLLLIGVVFAATNTRYGRDQVRVIVETQVGNLLVDAHLEIGQLDGNLFSGVEASDLRLLTTSGEELLHLEQLRARYQLLPLLRSHLILESIHLDGLQVSAAQQADSSWDWAGLMAPTEGESTWTINIDSVSARRVSARAAFRAGHRDSTLLVHALDISLGGFSLSPTGGIGVRQVRLVSAFQPPVRPDTVHLALEASYHDDTVSLDTLSLRSDRSTVFGQGTIDMAALPSMAFAARQESGALASDSTSFTLEAAPLSLSDLAPFLPSLQPTSEISADVEMRQVGHATRLKAGFRHTGGGVLTIDMDWTHESDGSRLVGLLEATRFDLDRLTNTSLVSSPMNAQLDVELSGASSDSLSGQSRMRLDSMTVNAWRVGATRLDVESVAGLANASMTTTFMGAALEASAAGRWLDPIPTATVEAQVDGLDIATWVETEGLSSDISAALSGSFSGRDLATMVSDVSVDLQPSRFGAVNGASGMFSFALEDALLSWTAEAQMGQGSMRSEGRLTLEETPVLESTTTRLRSLDVAALFEDAPDPEMRTHISALVRGQASLEDWRTGRGALQVQLDSTRWGAFLMAGTTAEASWSSGRANARIAAQPADTSSIVMEVDVRARGEQIRIESSELAWQGLDVSSMTSLDILDASLDGTGSLLMDLDGSDVTRLDLALRSAPSRWGNQEVNGLEAAIEADAATLVATASGAFSPVAGDGASIAAWQVQSDVQNWLSETSSARLEMTFDQLDPMAFAGLSDPGTALSGRAWATASLADGLPQTGAFQLDLDSSALRTEPVTQARIQGILQDSTITADAAFGVAQGRFEGDVTIRPFDAEPSFSSTGSVEQLNLLPLLGRGDLDSNVNLSWEASGTSFDPAEADWNLDVQGQPSRLDSLRLENLSMSASWDGRVLDIADLSSRFNSGSLQINGRVNLDPDRSDAYSDLRATWYIGDLNVIERLVSLDRLSSRSGTVDLQVFGSPDELEAEMLISLSDLEVETLHFSSIEASSWTTLDADFLPVSTTASVDIGYVALPTLAVRTTSVQVDQRGEIFSVSGRTMVDTGNRLSFSGQVNPFADRPWASLQELDILLGGEAFELERGASLLIDEGWQLNRLALSSGNQHVSLSGGVSDSSGYAIRMEMNEFDIAPVGLLAGLPDLEGRIGGQLLLSGPPEAPLIDSQLNLQLIENEQELALVLAGLQSTPEGLRVDATVSMEDSEDITLDGFLPIFASLGQTEEERADRSADLNLAIHTEGGSIRWLTPFLDPAVVADLEGVATMDIEVSGSIDDPQLEGFLNLDKTKFRLPEYGVTYRMDRLRSTLSGETIQVNEARLRSGDGSMDLSGSIDFASLTNSSFDLRAELDQFRAVRNKELQTTLSGDLQLTGRTTRPDLAGRLTTSNTSFWLTDTAGGDLEQVPLSFDDEVMLADNFGYRAVAADTLADAIWRGLSMDLSITIERDTWIRQRVNPEMAIELSGRVDLQKERGQDDLVIFRSIEVVPDRSTIKQFGRNFRIVEGVAQFNGPVEEMVLQVEAQYEVPSRLNPGQPEVVITLRLDGRLDDLAFNLSSDPAMENTDIVSYIATGRPASESLQFTDSGVNNQVLVGVAASQLAGLVEGVASESLGLDVVSIEQDGLKGTRLTAGKYLTPRLFVGVTQPFSFSGGSSIVVDEERELTFEYEVFEYLLLQLLADASDSPVRINIAGRYSY